MSALGRIIVVTGPPGAGKSTLCQAFALTCEKSFVVPVDDIRLWVKSGLADAFDWNQEAERQYGVAELGACRLAKLYANNGFTVLIDHCRNLPRWDEVLGTELAGVEVVRLALVPSLHVNLDRNSRRINKAFDPVELEQIIRDCQAGFPASRPGWIILDNSEMTVEECVEFLKSVANRSSIGP